jgi:hypothetical protein
VPIQGDRQYGIGPWTRVIYGYGADIYLHCLEAGGVLQGGDGLLESLMFLACEIHACLHMFISIACSRYVNK